MQRRECKNVRNEKYGPAFWLSNNTNTDITFPALYKANSVNQVNSY